jgi:hypothetical protein
VNSSVRRQVPGLEARDVERRAEQVDELDRLPLERGGDLALLGGERAERALVEQARVADQRVQGRAEVVRHRGERVALHARDVGEPPALTRVRERDAREPGERACQLQLVVDGVRVEREDQVERAPGVAGAERDDERADRRVAVHLMDDDRPRAAAERRADLGLAERRAVVPARVLGRDAVRGEHAVHAVLRDADRRARDAEEGRDPLHEAVGKRLEVAARQEQRGLEVEELFDPDRVEADGRRRRDGLRRAIFLLPHRCGGM